MEPAESKPGPREQLVEQTGDEELLFADGYDEAIIGYVHRCGEDPIVVYDAEKCIDLLVEDSGMDRDEAEEFFDFNVVGGWVGKRTPAFLVRRSTEGG